MTKETILGMSRIELINLLSYNDPNGIYTDSESIAEFGNIMTKEEGVEIALRQFELI